MDFLRTLRQPPKTILTTSYREYALEGYELDIVDYLVKPITFDRFFKAIERYLRSNPQPVTASTEQEEAFIFIKSAHKYLKLHTADILYIESVKDYVKIQTRGDGIIAKYKIGDLERELRGKGFYAFTDPTLSIGSRLLPSWQQTLKSARLSYRSAKVISRLYLAC